ncbi:MAG: YebC/PmpR family DNA-binding transcriptional regulator [bacterium]|jgi:YebC/PmpR family DNA-binding regulatory protein
MSGHNKWSSIKHRKGAQDAKRGALFSKIIRDIVVAVREGGANEENNAALKTMLEKARAANMPKDTVERAIARGSGGAGGTKYETIIFEGYGPGGVAVIVEALTDNRNRAVSDIRHAFSKSGGNLGETGCVSWMFERKGRFEIPAEGFDEDSIMELVLESPADDYSLEGDVYVVTSKPECFGAARQFFESKEIELNAADLVLVPKSTVPISDEKTASQLLRLMDSLEDLDDVQSVSANWEMDDEILEKAAG